MKLIWPLLNILFGGNDAFAEHAIKKQPPQFHFSGALEKRFLAFRKAVWAKPMRWFGSACLRLQDASHGSGPNGFKLIALLLSVPCFKASHFCFKRVYR